LRNATVPCALNTPAPSPSRVGAAPSARGGEEHVRIACESTSSESEHWLALVVRDDAGALHLPLIDLIALRSHRVKRRDDKRDEQCR
jgi:hypothetical protein